MPRDAIEQFVRAFYGRVQSHPTLGPIFNARLDGHWEAHFDRLTDFWLTMLTGTPAYKGDPFSVHLAIEEIKPELFDDWLALFTEVAGQELDGDMAALATRKAHRIADSLKQGLFFRPKAQA